MHTGMLPAALLVSVAVTVASHAASFQVTNTLDASLGSLRWAISNANATAGADTIICTNLLGRISLESPLPPITGATTILGPGASLLAISGSNLFRVFEIAGGTTVSITGVTISDGYVTNGGGAGILNAGNLTLIGCAVAGNRSVSVPGGGLLNRGKLMLVSSELASNIAGGAGIPFGTYTTFGDLRGIGGGLYLESGTVIISNCVVIGNQAIGTWGFLSSGGALGGGVFVQGGQLSITGTTVSGNLAVGGYGGSDYLLVGRRGANGFGGGICVQTNAPAAQLMVNCTVSGNRSQGGDGGGGGHYGGDGGNGYGGGIVAGVSNVSLANCTVYQNIAAGGTGGPGGTVYPYHSGYPGSGSGAGIYSFPGGVAAPAYLVEMSGSGEMRWYPAADLQGTCRREK